MSVDRRTAWPYDEHGEPGAFTYQRYAHPTGTAAEDALGELEGGQALLFSSGTAAVTASVFALCKPGTTIALAEGAYFGTGVTFAQFSPWGLNVVEFDQTGMPPDDADVVWLESPSNPLLTLPNWEPLRDHTGMIVCDATASTPVYLRALDEGADIVLHSATKYLTGHHDALLGALVTRNPDIAERLYYARMRLGLSAAPDAAAMLLRGLDSLELRVCGGRRRPRRSLPGGSPSTRRC
jgi:cystathionine gamma-synthase